MTRHSLSPRAALSLGIILWLVAAAVLCLDLQTWRLQSRAAEVYESIDGTVLSVALQEHHRRRGSGDSWSPRIGYRYDVRGRTYESDVYAFARVAFADRNAAQRILDAHPVGGTIRVHFDPDEPERCVLAKEPPSAAGWWFPLLLGLSGVVIVRSAVRRSRAAGGLVRG